jgi:hypothetical protein
MESFFAGYFEMYNSSTSCGGIEEEAMTELNGDASVFLPEPFPSFHDLQIGNPLKKILVSIVSILLIKFVNSASLMLRYR